MKNFAILLLAFYLLPTDASTPRQDWLKFKHTHQKRYENTQEERHRHSVFLKNKRLVEEHNKRHARGEVTFRLALNKYADLEVHERKAILNGLKKIAETPERTRHQNFHSLPDSVDLRNDGYVTPVKDQGECGSCWAFSATGALEGAHYNKTGRLVPLSEQNLLDCSWNYGNEGCEGGTMEKAFQFIIDNKGIDTEVAYPYEGDDGPCRFLYQYVGSTEKSYHYIPEGDEDQLKAAVATIGPISVGIDASSASFHFYESGVYYEKDCDSEELDHGVLVVGYGTEQGSDYWLIKNSWGKDWGDQGYIKLARNKDNHCGVASYAGYPIL